MGNYEIKVKIVEGDKQWYRTVGFKEIVWIIC